MLELLARPAVAAPALLLVGYILYHLLLRPSKLPDLPIVGAKEGDWFPMLQARWRNIVDFETGLSEGYQKYKGQPVIIPASHRTSVMLPLSEIEWFVNQPDDVLSFHLAAHESLQLDHTTLDRRLAHDTANNRVVTVTLNSQLGNLVPDMLDEVRFGFEKCWGDKPGESREVNLYDTTTRIIAGVTARIILGDSFSRDEDFLKLSTACAQDLPISAQLLTFIWKPLRPVLAPIVTLAARTRLRRYKRAIAPEVNRRLAAWDARVRDAESEGGKFGTTDGEPNDFLQWTIRHAKESGNPTMWELDILAGRTLMLNFAAIHTSSLTQTAAVLELAASDPSVAAELRAEVSAVVAEHGWTKRSLARMEKLDSVFRESARLNSFVTLGMERKVVAPGGVTTPSGLHVPQGGTVCLPAYGVLHDEAVYPDADKFRSFRFSDARADDAASYVERARNAFPTTKPEFLAFGHGRHACPGRFFAALELKMIMAYIVLNYDISQRQKTPSMWYGMNRVPDLTANIRIQRREKS
ncbi:hypothetical protein MCOR25_001547 [Pyricularia grisea]|uniref:Cytochrome P450 n=1 Tax=Pyricularia grisea TaxID=148305 RepID=A0A6P8BL47_PYRGI|nr:uncharacterized protein PgNI_01033 [Pyricularia grisea]KAI6380610.1 hypothetical protein MCOR25_001547 [Pyricularia grisea]TLD17414.1 hypothetical protein PgNI_01033 [Pyricularia grisea]